MILFQGLEIREEDFQMDRDNLRAILNIEINQGIKFFD